MWTLPGILYTSLGERKAAGPKYELCLSSGLGGSVREEQAKLTGGVITERNLEDGRRTKCTLPGEAQRCQWDESQHQLGVTGGALFGPVASKQTACKGLAK